MRTKVCSKCKVRQPHQEFPSCKTTRDGLHSWCRECKRALDRTRKRQRYQDPERGWGRNLRSKYGITPEEYESLLEDQGGRCAICGRGDNGRAGATRLAVDHDHTSGRVRGLLCDACNRGIGFLQNSSEVLEKAASYLRKS